MADKPVRKKASEQAEPAHALASVTVADIKELFGLMKANEIAELNLEHKDTKIHIVSVRANPQQGTAVQQMMPMVSGMAPMGMMSIPQQPAQPAQASQPSGPPAAAEVPAKPEPAPSAESEVPSNLRQILSPMVGTFYRAPSPDANPFVKVGDRVSEETVLCIIEAMKLMNEIKAETAGRIVKILVENAHPVEFNQPLFLIEPA